jgi:hypothetical protein
MLTPFNVFAVVVVFLLWWIGSNVQAIAKRGEPARGFGCQTGLELCRKCRWNTLRFVHLGVSWTDGQCVGDRFLHTICCS